MKKQKKPITNLYVDGSNIYGAQWELFGPKKYLDFSSVIEVINNIYPLNKTYFYASYSPLPKSKSRKPPNYILNERLFYYSARKHPKVVFYTGHRSRASGKEKGVDVHLACDIVKHVTAGQVDRVCLMSGDADLLYPLEIAKEFKKNYSVFVLPNRILPDMIYAVKDYYVLQTIPLSVANKLTVFRKYSSRINLLKCLKQIAVNSIKNPGASTRG